MTREHQDNNTTVDGRSSLDINVPSGQEELGKSIDRTITPNHEPRVFFFDIDNCLYPKDSGIPGMMRTRIEQYFEDVGIEDSQVKMLAQRYYIDYGLAIRGLRIHHPDDKVDGSLDLEHLLKPNPALREVIRTMKIEKKWLFTNAGKNHALRVIKVLGLEGIFDGLTYCDYLEPNFPCKPETESFRRAMRDAGIVHASNCYFVDDSAANVDKAMDIGWTAVHVADDPVISNFGHFQIDNIIDLPKVLPEFWEERSSYPSLTTEELTSGNKTIIIRIPTPAPAPAS